MPSRRKRCSVCGQLHNMEDLRKFKTSEALVCTDCINNSNGEMVECDECHLVHVKYEHFENDEVSNRTDTTEINGKNVCDSCRDRLYIQCESCGLWIRKSDILQIQDYLVCHDCAENEFVECDTCGARVPSFTLENVNHGEQRVCSSCARSFPRCADCGELIGDSLRRERIGRYNSTDYVCDVCAENYTECEDCHRLINGEVYHDEDEGYAQCENCHNSGGASVIHGYHCGEEFVKRMTNDDDINEKLFFGLELEVAGNQNYAKKFLKLFEPQTIQLMRDSSVAGFEIITMPMTYKFLMRNFIPQLKKGLAFLIEKDFKGHNAGGLHIHVSEDAITKCQAAQLGEILYGNNNDKTTWQRISQRKTENLHWCSLSGNRKFYDITDDTAEKPAVCNSRHTALNHDSIRTHTYEFRIFNSSLRIDRILKNIECVVALLDYTKKYAYKDRPVCHTTDFLKYVTDRRIFYPNLNAFLEENRIVEQHMEKDFSGEDTANEMEVA